MWKRKMKKTSPVGRKKKEKKPEPVNLIWLQNTHPQYSKEAKIIFRDIHLGYHNNEDIYCNYVSSDHVQPGPDHKVAIFYCGWDNIEEEICCVPATNEMMSIFPAEILPASDQKMVQFCYLVTGEVYGASMPFRIWKGDNDKIYEKEGKTSGRKRCEVEEVAEHSKSKLKIYHQCSIPATSATHTVNETETEQEDEVLKEQSGILKSDPQSSREIYNEISALVKCESPEMGVEEILMGNNDLQRKCLELQQQNDQLTYYLKESPEMGVEELLMGNNDLERKCLELQQQNDQLTYYLEEKKELKLTIEKQKTKIKELLVLIAKGEEEKLLYTSQYEIIREKNGEERKKILERLKIQEEKVLALFQYIKNIDG